MSGRQVRTRTKYFVLSMRARGDPAIDWRVRRTATDLRAQEPLVFKFRAALAPRARRRFRSALDHGDGTRD